MNTRDTLNWLAYLVEEQGSGDLDDLYGDMTSALGHLSTSKHAGSVSGINARLKSGKLSASDVKKAAAALNEMTKETESKKLRAYYEKLADRLVGASSKLGSDE